MRIGYISNIKDGCVKIGFVNAVTEKQKQQAFSELMKTPVSFLDVCAAGIFNQEEEAVIRNFLERIRGIETCSAS